MIRSTMQRVPLSLNHFLERAGKLFPESEIVSRLPDKSFKRQTLRRFLPPLAPARRGAAGGGAERRATGWRRCAGTTTRTWSAISASRPRAG